MQKVINRIKAFELNDSGIIVKIKQPRIDELNSLYHVLLNNIKKIKRKAINNKKTL